MNAQHYCLNDNYPGGRITCFCTRGEDHPEHLFAVSVGAEPTSAALAVADVEADAYLNNDKEQ